MNETLLALLDELARFGTANDARETERPRRMLNITPATGRLLWILVRQARATRILEVGTSNAYSTIWLADAARETGGRVVTLEADPGKVALARENLGRAGLLDHVDIREGRATDTLARLPGPFDLVFLDAEKDDYEALFRLARPLLEPGGLVVADNVLSHVETLGAYSASRQADPTLSSVTVPLDRGLELSVVVGTAI